MPRYSSEAYLLSALLTSRDAHGAEKRGITPEMFAGYGTEYRWFLSYVKTYSEVPSIETFKQRFPGFPLTPNEDVRFSADEVREDFNRRQLAKSIRGAAEHLRQGDLDSALLEWGGFSPNRAGVELLDTLGDDAFLEFYDSPRLLIPTPWETLTTLTGGGIRVGDYWVIAARLGQGKSWTMAVMACLAIMSGFRVIIYSLEMTKEDVHQRMHALLAVLLGYEVSYSELRDRTFSRREYKALLADIRDNVPGKFFVVDSTSGPISPATVAAHSEAADLHFVDYIGLMRNTDGTRSVDDWRNAASISNQLKEVAQAKSTRVVALSQINREGDTGGWKPPKSKHLSQADAIGQDADVIITAKKYSESAMTYLLDKNRGGIGNRLFWTNFSLDGAANFDEISRDRADAIREREQTDD